MNPKQEFIKSIMSVLRLEQNIYTMGAIETIIERLKVSDYALFVAYLGERKSDYEKPIESIAKGVDEFYSMKLEPYRSKIKETQTFVIDAFKYIESTTINNLVKDDGVIEKATKYVNDNYTMQDEDSKKTILKDKIREFARIEADEKIDKFYSTAERDHKAFSLKKTNNDVVFTNEVLDAIFDIGLINFHPDNNKRYELLFEKLFNEKIKPSISEQITITEVKKIYEPKEISETVKKLLSQRVYKEIVL